MIKRENFDTSRVNKIYNSNKKAKRNQKTFSQSFHTLKMKARLTVILEIS